MLSIQEYLHQATETKMDFDFSRSQAMADVLLKDHPLPASIVIGGTNGKGSTTAFLSSIFQEHGLNVGTFTSPHIRDVFERISINKKNIDEEKFNSIGEQVLRIMQNIGVQCTYFEVLTFITWIYFCLEKPDVCLFEVGLGGRLDTTNTIKKTGSILTKIDLDHTSLLGNSTYKIAQEKVPILSTNGINVIAKQDEQAHKAIDQYFDRNKNYTQETLDFHHNGNDQDFSFENDHVQLSHCRLGLHGQHQCTNASLAVEMATRYFDATNQSIDKTKIVTALQTTKVPGRLERWIKQDQVVLLDIAHNPSSIQTLVQTLSTQFPTQKFQTLFGCSSDKDAHNMLTPLSKISADITCTAFTHPRSWNSHDQKPLLHHDEKRAFDSTLQKADGPILCTGSIFFISCLMPILEKYGFEKA